MAAVAAIPGAACNGPRDRSAGRGQSGDGREYHFTREFEDVAAVVDAVAEASGSSVDLYGHSVGGLFAFGGATLTSDVRRLVLYEGWPLVNPDAHALHVVDEDLSVLRAQPSWPARVAVAHTLPRELRATSEAKFDPAQAAKIAVPTLLLTGDQSSDPMAADTQTVAAALPDARIIVLAGQEHVADVLAPELFAQHVLAFLREGR